MRIVVPEEARNTSGSATSAEPLNSADGTIRVSVDELRTALARRFPRACGETPIKLVRPVSLPGDGASAEEGPNPGSDTSHTTSSLPVSGPDWDPPSHLPQSLSISEGAITEIVGQAGAGGCTLVLQRMVSYLAASKGRYAAFVDMAGEIYPPAIAALGVPLNQLLLIQVPEVTLALRAVETLLRGGAARFVVLDLPAGVRPLRYSTYHRLRRHVMENSSSLVFLTPQSVSPADRRLDLDERASTTLNVSRL